MCSSETVIQILWKLIKIIFYKNDVKEILGTFKYQYVCSFPE
jgi:hypothetical protein